MKTLKTLMTPPGHIHGRVQGNCPGRILEGGAIRVGDGVSVA
ncbi:MAG: hypothetical protein ACT6S0_17025 [Roseateles sp.]